MGKDKELKQKYGNDLGFRVPDGYFDTLNSRIMDQLPSYPAMPHNIEMSRWERLKPYVYLAAMFAGIWLMMNMLNHLSGGFGTVSLENPPEQIVSAMSDYPSEVGMRNVAQASFNLEADITDSYDSISDFADDFGYEFRSEYANMTVDFPSTDSNHDGGSPV